MQSPFEHGEVFVLDDGGETDLDLGNYERFLSVSLTKDSNLSTGKIYQSVIERERVGEYLGKTVQVVPHVSDGAYLPRIVSVVFISDYFNQEDSLFFQFVCVVFMFMCQTAIQEWILRVAKTPVSRFSKSASESVDNPDEPPEVCIVELGGTLGDIESMPFVEALRQLQENLGYKNVRIACLLLISLFLLYGILIIFLICM